jgi:hypothetical protein
MVRASRAAQRGGRCANAQMHREPSDRSARSAGVTGRMRDARGRGRPQSPNSCPRLSNTVRALASICIGVEDAVKSRRTSTAAAECAAAAGGVGAARHGAGARGAGTSAPARGAGDRRRRRCAHAVRSAAAGGRLGGAASAGGAPAGAGGAVRARGLAQRRSVLRPPPRRRHRPRAWRLREDPLHRAPGLDGCGLAQRAAAH